MRHGRVSFYLILGKQPTILPRDVIGEGSRRGVIYTKGKGRGGEEGPCGARECGTGGTVGGWLAGWLLCTVSVSSEKDTLAVRPSVLTATGSLARTWGTAAGAAAAAALSNIEHCPSASVRPPLALSSSVIRLADIAPLRARAAKERAEGRNHSKDKKAKVVGITAASGSGLTGTRRKRGGLNNHSHLSYPSSLSLIPPSGDCLSCLAAFRGNAPGHSHFV